MELSEAIQNVRHSLFSDKQLQTSLHLRLPLTRFFTARKEEKRVARIAAVRAEHPRAPLVVLAQSFVSLDDAETLVERVRNPEAFKPFRCVVCAKGFDNFSGHVMRHVQRQEPAHQDYVSRIPQDVLDRLKKVRRAQPQDIAYVLRVGRLLAPAPPPPAPQAPPVPQPPPALVPLPLDPAPAAPPPAAPPPAAAAAAAQRRRRREQRIEDEEDDAFRPPPPVRRAPDNNPQRQSARLRAPNSNALRRVYADMVDWEEDEDEETEILVTTIR